MGIVQIYTENNHELFGVFWYIYIGYGLCLAMILYSFSSKASELFELVVVVIKRWYDRAGSCSIWQKNARDSDIPNTKKLR